jgi:hypothetical protein
MLLIKPQILSDGRCLGACALFVRLMEEGGLAHVVAPFTNPPALAAPNLPGLLTSASLVYCQLSAQQNAYLTTDPAVRRVMMPLAGQELLIPLSLAVLADSGGFLNRSRTLAPVGPSMGSLEQDMIRHFPASAKASYCLPQLYSEALAAGQVCALSGLEAARDRLVGLGQELCTMAHATEALRSCNSTCTDPKAVCVQYSPVFTGLCQPVCWSKCSAVACQDGYERVWVADRHVAHLLDCCLLPL